MAPIDSDWPCLVVGGGLAGMVTARRLQQLGIRSLVLEKGGEEGGLANARISGGLIHLAWGAMDDDPVALRQRLVDETDGEIEPALATMLAENAGRALHWLADEGVETRPKGEARYQRHALHPHRPGGGRRIQPEYGPDRMMAALYRNFRDLGGEVRLGAAGDGLHGGGPAAPWRVTYRGSGAIAAVSGAAVLVADGGFQANPEMLARYVGPNAGLALLRAMPGSTGDGLRMLLAVGAGTAGLGRVYGHLVSHTALENDELWPHPPVDKLCLAGALVDRSGLRLRHGAATGISLVGLLARSEDPRGYAVVFDEALWETAGRDNPYNTAVPNPDLPARGGHLVSGATIAELAGRLGVEGEALERAVAEHNQESPGQPITRAPFHAARVVPGITFTMGGVRIDPTAAVVDREGLPLAGLFAAGSCVGGIHGGPRGGYAGGLAVALITGLVAGESIARVVTAPAAGG